MSPARPACLGRARIADEDQLGGQAQGPQREARLQPRNRDRPYADLRADQIVIPRGPDRANPGDRLIIFAAADTVRTVRDYFAST